MPSKQQGVKCKVFCFCPIKKKRHFFYLDDDGAVCTMVSSASGTVSMVTRWTGLAGGLAQHCTVQIQLGVGTVDCMGLSTKAALG